jgi:hypothetical protein
MVNHSNEYRAPKEGEGHPHKDWGKTLSDVATSASTPGQAQ